jgi:hypothetical protein
MRWIEADVVLRAQLEDAQRDVRRWLACTLPNEERLYARGIQGRLAALEQIVDHRIYGLASDHEEDRWDENKRAFLELFHKATGMRGCAAGEHLSRLAALLKEHAKAQAATNTRGLEGKQRISQSDANAEFTAKSWDEIEISFLSDERVEIRTCGQPKTYNYGELGLADHRGGKRGGKPNLAWATLRTLAESDGILKQPPPGSARGRVEKRIQEIRNKLRTHFGIEADPIPLSSFTYRTSFKISCKRSYDT